MRIIKIGVVLLSLLAWPASATVRSVNQNEFSFLQVAREQALIHRDNCIILFMKYFKSARPVLAMKDAKLEKLAEALCENSGIYNSYLAQNSGFVSNNPLNNAPLLLSIQKGDIEPDEWIAILSAIRHSLYKDPHDSRTFRGININLHQPYRLSPDSRYAITVHVDDWIEHNEKDEPGKLLKWLDFILARRDTRVTVVALANYSPIRYAVEGHPEVAEFLEHFQPVRLGLHKEACVRDLELPQ